MRERERERERERVSFLACASDNDVDVSPTDEEVPVAIIVGVLVPIVLLCGIVLFILYWKIKHRQRISHELELAARRNWRRLAQNFAISTKHELPTVEEYANHSKRVRKKKKKKKDRKLNGETLSVHSQTVSMLDKFFGSSQTSYHTVVSLVSYEACYSFTDCLFYMLIYRV